MIIKEGMDIRISTNLQKTSDHYGVTPEMVKMKGGIYNVKYYTGDVVEIWDSENKRSWMFSKYDIQPAKINPPAKPVTFNPANIDVGK